MLYSMTGFASKIISIEPEPGNRATLTLSLKSLNSRFFEASCRLPYALSQFETDFIKILKNNLHRGHVYFTIHLSDQNIFKTEVEPALATLNAYLKAIKEIQKQANVKGEASISDILQLPNIFILQEKGIDDDTKNKIYNAVKSLINDLIEERKKEGSILEKDLEKRFALMHDKILEIEKLFEIEMQKKKEEVSLKLEEINKESETFAEVQRQALYYVLDRLDITEEIVRFKSHLENIKKILASSNIEKGKQLDFTMQELGREINTIASKGPSTQINQLAITVKVEIEKSREQVQNIL